MKRVASFVTVLILVTIGVSNLARSAETTYSDVPKDFYAYEGIEYLTEQGVVHGYSENGQDLYKPGNKITRSQAAIMLVRAKGLKPMSKSSQPYFNDVSPDRYSYGYIQRAAQQGFFKGYSGNTFRPGNSLTRSHMSVILIRAFEIDKVKNKPSPFNDVNSNTWYQRYIKTYIL